MRPISARLGRPGPGMTSGYGCPAEGYAATIFAVAKIRKAARVRVGAMVFSGLEIGDLKLS